MEKKQSPGIVRSLLKQFLNEVADITPYLLLFYFTVLLLAIFFASWRQFFNWPVVHGGILFFCFLALGSERMWHWLHHMKQIAHTAEVVRQSMVASHKVSVPKRAWLLRAMRWQGFNVLGSERMWHWLHHTKQIAHTAEVVRPNMVAVQSVLKRAWLLYAMCWQGFNIIMRGVIVLARGIRQAMRYGLLGTQQVGMLMQLRWQQLLILPWHKKVVVIGILLAAVGMIQWGIDGVNVIIFSYGLAAILLAWSARGAVIGCLIVLMGCVVQVQHGKLESASATAVYAYYFMVIAVIIVWRDARKQPQSAKIGGMESCG